MDNQYKMIVFDTAITSYRAAELLNAGHIIVSFENPDYKILALRGRGYESEAALLRALRYRKEENSEHIMITARLGKDAIVRLIRFALGREIQVQY